MSTPAASPVRQRIYERRRAVQAVIKDGGKFYLSHKQRFAEEYGVQVSALEYDLNILRDQGCIRRAGKSLVDFEYIETYYHPSELYRTPETDDFYQVEVMTRFCMRCGDEFETTKNGPRRCGKCHRWEREHVTGYLDTSYRVVW